MEENNNTATGIERAEEISGIIGNIGGFLAGRTNNPLIEAGWETLSGHSGLATSLGDLLNKLHNGTATSDDVADVLQGIAGIMAGVGVMANVANPRILALLGLVGTARELLGYIEDHPELTQEMKGIINNPANLQEWSDIWGFFNNEFQISSNTNELFKKSKNNNSSYISPLVLDLDGDGIEIFGISAETHVVFDHDGDGIKNGTGWVGSDDGLFVLDRDGNGLIESGNELFGVYTEVNGTRAENGFIALIDQDTNDDGVFDASDANFSNVRVWRDLNSNGISESTELSTLIELGIASFNLNYTLQNTTVTGGNVSIATSTFTKTDGSVSRIDDIDFIANNFYREFDELPLDETAMLLPKMQGSGMVRDLAEASMLSSDLKEGVLSMMNQGYVGKDKLMAQIDSMLLQWADTSAMKSSIDIAQDIGKTLLYVPYGGSNIKAPLVEMLTAAAGTSFSTDYEIIRAEQSEISRKIDILERFNGETFLQINGNVFQGIGDTRLTDDVMSFNISTPGNALTTGTEPYVFAHLSPFQLKYLEESYEALRNSVYNGIALQTRLQPYIDAIDLVIDGNGISVDMSRVIAMLDNLAQTDIQNAIYDWDDIVYMVQDQINTIDIGVMLDFKEWLTNTVNNPVHIEQLKSIEEGLILHDGVFNIHTYVDNSISFTIDNETPLSGSSNDIITGTPGDDTFDGKGGNDTIITGAGNDILVGGIGNDNLIASSGDDTLNGGLDNDILQGGMGNDTYLFNRGDGGDTINDSAYAYGYTGTDTYQAGNDMIRFGEGISAEDVVACKSGNNLILALKEEGKTFEELSDTITLTNWYNVYNRIENLVFTDGTVLNTNSAILGLVATEGDDTIIGTEQVLNIDAKEGNDIVTASNGAGNTIHSGIGNDTITTGSGADTVYGDDGDDKVVTGAGTDVLIGGSGNDNLIASSGNDTLDGGTDNDILQGGMGNDVYVFNRGDGTDIIYDSNWAYGYTGTDTYQAGADMIRFGEGISAEDIVARKSGNNLILGLKEEGKTFEELSDTITITNWYSIYNRIENITFADGTVLSTSSAILSLAATDGDDTIQGTEQALSVDAKGGNDTITASNGVSNIIHGGAGNDTLSTTGGADTLYGDAGNDVIYTGAGNDILVGGIDNDNLIASSGDDTLNGGLDNDILQGGMGNDTYLFNRGDGQDIIHDSNWAYGYTGTDTYQAGNDMIRFGEGIGTSDISIYKNGSSVLLSYADNDVINIANQFVTNNAIEKFTLNDGNYLTSNDLNVIIQSMNAYAAEHEIAIDSIDSVKSNQDLMNIISGAWHQ